jgi:hypothetical protein
MTWDHRDAAESAESCDTEKREHFPSVAPDGLAARVPLMAVCSA